LLSYQTQTAFFFEFCFDFRRSFLAYGERAAKSHAAALPFSESCCALHERARERQTRPFILQVLQPSALLHASPPETFNYNTNFNIRNFMEDRYGCIILGLDNVDARKVAIA
jgi:hypothetical protein